MNKVEQIRRRFSPGARIRCLENTYIPSHRGETFRVTASGRSKAEAVSEKDGSPYRVTLPTRVRDVLAVYPDRVSFLIDEEGNYSRWEFLPGD